MAVWRSPSCTTPKNKHLVVLPQGKVQETFCGQISQLKVCQLLTASPQVIYPVGLNGQDEPIITTLPDPLGSGISLITSKHNYLEIDIPLHPMEEPHRKMPPLEDIPTIWVTSPLKSPPKPEGSITTEVSNLLSQAVLEASSCESQQSLPRRLATAVVLMSPSQRPEGLLLPADTSSQASIDEGEASLGDILANISPIAVISGSNSTSALMALTELQTNANKAPDDLLSTKESIDTRRQRAVWDLGVMFCQNETQVAATVQEAKTICSQTALGIQTACSQLILEVKTTYLVAVKEAKTTRSHLLQEAKATCSKVICEAEAQKIFQATRLHNEPGKYTQDLEEQAIEEESKIHNDFLTTCQVVLYSSPPPLKSALASLYHLLLGQAPPSPPLASPKKTSPMGKEPTTTVPPMLMPKQPPKPKRWHPLPDPVESMPIGGATPKATLGGSSSPKRQDIPHWFTTPKPLTMPRHSAKTPRW